VRVHVSAFWTQKEGSSPAEYEDSFWPRHVGEKNRKRRLRFAVADGASEAMLSGLWANVLVRSFIGSRSREFEKVYGRALRVWESEYGAYLARRKANGRPIEWYEEPGLERGAFATLLGLSLTSPREGGSGNWTAVAVGDTCVFQVRRDELVAAFPLQRSDQFDITPDLVASKPRSREAVIARSTTAHGLWIADDQFYLATDAIAAWFLREFEHGDRPWRVLRDLDTQAAPDFLRWVRELRERKRIRNDDVTLLRVDIHAP
jgi:hypothetical protein